MIEIKQKKTCCEVCFNEACSCKGKQNKAWNKQNKCTSYKTEEDINKPVQEDEEDEVTQIKINYSPYWPF